MLLTIFLDALSAIGYGEAILQLIKWGCLALVAVVLLVGFILVVRPDRESIQEEPVQMRDDDFLLWGIVALALIAFSIWLYLLLAGGGRSRLG
jgi:hypothetical protein